MLLLIGIDIALALDICLAIYHARVLAPGVDIDLAPAR